MNDYLERVGLSRLVDLPDLMQAHLTHIPFENLSVLANQPILLDIDALWQKLVLDKRGGYCFEHNTLFEHILKQAGYQVVPLQARVRRGTQEIRPHTHKLLRVAHQGMDYLVDVGFGGHGPLRPLPWYEGSALEFQPGIMHRLITEEGLWVLQSRHDRGEWVDLYATNNEPAQAVDYEMANWFTSTHPGSIFVNSMLVGLHHPTGSSILFDGMLKQRLDGHTETRCLSSDDEVCHLLEHHFHLPIPTGMRVPPLCLPASLQP